MNTYLATAEAHIQLRGRIGSLEDALRSAHLHGVSVQDIDAVEWVDPMNAHVKLALIVPVKDGTEHAGDEMDHIIRISLTGEEFTIAKGSMVITKVFEVMPFEEEY